MSEKVAGKTAPQRLALCRSLLDLREKISKASSARSAMVRVMSQRRMRAVRSLLLGSTAPSLADDMLAPGAAGERLLSELQALKDATPSKRTAFALYAKGIMATLRALEMEEGRDQDTMKLSGYPPELIDGIKGILSADAYETADPLIDESIERGKFSDDLRDELVAAKNASTVATEKLSSLERALVENYDKVEKELLKLRDQIRPTGDESTYRERTKEYEEFHAEVYSKAREAKLKELRIRREAEAAALSQVGAKLIARVTDASPVSTDEATRWAAAQEITKPAVARLKKIGYPMDQVRADMAEFYRFTGGRVSVVRVHSKGDRRANATDIEAHGKVGTINLDTSFSKRVLWHELAHHMEADPVAKTAAGRFIRRRSVDGKTHTLRKLAGHNGYRSDEIALQGNFFNPYVGKVYQSGITEVFSMAVESFSDPTLLARRAVEDPQTLEFVSGFLREPMDPLGRAHMELRNALQEIVGDVEDADDDFVTEKIAFLASMVTLVPSDDVSWAVSRRIDWHIRGFTMIGTITLPATGLTYYVLSGKVRQYATRRQVAGFRLIEKSDSFGNTSGYDIATKDKSMLRALVALYMGDGRMRYPHELTADSLRRMFP